ncbi:MAG: hypothetical protein OEX19_06290 [Gammaproteobacteria bacterium]|nr:hypothetical protein [Gammaproteobacteria bacterium]
MSKLKIRLIDASMAVLAICVGAIIIYVGDHLLGIKLEIFRGIIGTFSPLWIVDLIVLPLFAGVVVSLIYGLGSKIIAYFPPLLVRIPEYLNADASVYGSEASVLPFGYWVLLVIVVVEACGIGGWIGEVYVKRTYGRSPKEHLHRRYQVKAKPDSEH